MIIGLEWICFVLLFVALASILLAATKSSVLMAVLSVLSLISSIGLFGGLKSAQDNVQEHYIDYLQLQTKVVQYEDLDFIEQYEVLEDVITYNNWYDRNKAYLENEWSLKGSSTYAKEFDYIIIGG